MVYITVVSCLTVKINGCHECLAVRERNNGRQSKEVDGEMVDNEYFYLKNGLTL